MDSANVSVDDIFCAALELAAPEQRAAYLDKACGNDLALRQRVQRLLEAHAAAGSFLAAHPPVEPVPSDSTRDARDPSAEITGAMIGPYKLIEPIGEGGMGTVWMAQQTEPVKRLVAVKLIKAGMDSAQVIARFEAERQALALMDHPNIARVLDAGTTGQNPKSESRNPKQVRSTKSKIPSEEGREVSNIGASDLGFVSDFDIRDSDFGIGRPYFVMDLVRGVPITKYCDEHHLTPRQRLELFIPVCQAVQHAHQKGIIHRDLKPSNVLVALYDGKPVPKVIDFGVAKAAGQALTEKTLVTGFGAIVGTLEYMSPEQAEINQLDIDTRSDIYSLGVLLYELLTGSPPFSRKELEKAGMIEMLRVIREEEPSKPSTKLSTAEGLPTLAANRGTEPTKLTKLVRGELDWIVMKALEKDRSRRYETANGFAMDLQRYLADEPVQACPPSAGYRFRKSVRRHRAALVTTAVVALALILGTMVSVLQAVRATVAEDLAQQRLEAEKQAHQDADAARLKAEANFQRARKVVDEYFTLVSESKLFDVPGMQPLRKELLEAAVRFYEEFARERTNDPAVLADLAVTYLRMGEVYLLVNRADDAIAAFRRGLDLVDRLRREHPAAAERHRKLAGYWKGLRRVQIHIEGPTDPDAALKTLLRWRNTWQELAARHTAESNFQSDLAAIEVHLGDFFTWVVRRPDDAVTYYRHAHARLDRLVSADPKTLRYRADLALVSQYLAQRLTSKSKEGESFLQQAQALLETLVADAPAVPTYRDELALALLATANRMATVEPRRAEDTYRRAIRLVQALVIEFPTMRLYRQRLSSAWVAFAGFLRTRGRAEEAEKQLREALAFFDKLMERLPLPPTAGEEPIRLNGELAALLRGPLNRRDEAAQAVAQAVAIQEKLAAQFPDEIRWTEHLGHVLRLQAFESPRAEAEGYFQRSVAVFDRLATKYPEPHYQHFLADTTRLLGHAAVAANRLEDAEKRFRSAVALHENRVLGFPKFRLNPPAGASEWERALSYSDLAWLLTRMNRPEEVKGFYETSLEIAPTHPVAQNGLAWFLATWPEPKWRDPGHALRLAKQAVAAAPKEGRYWTTLGVAHYRVADWKAAIDALAKSMELRKGGDAREWFFLAMSHWQLDQKEQARAWHDRATAWMDKHQPKNEELRRFRAEAEELFEARE